MNLKLKKSSFHAHFFCASWSTFSKLLRKIEMPENNLSKI